VSQELDILKTVTQRLERAAIPYMITGSIAANFYAIPRMTRDIDIVIEIEGKDASLLLTLFQDDFYIDSQAVRQALAERGMFNIIHNKHIVKVDFIIKKEDPYRVLEFKRRRPIQVEDARMSIVSLEDLILSKLFWAKDSHSEMQLSDVKKLLDVEHKIDMPYLEKWVQSLGLDAVYQKVR